MIVYRDQRAAAEPREVLRALRRRLERFPRRAEHDEVIGLVVELGALEAGIADALAPHEDEDSAVPRELRRAAIAAGHLVVASWREDEDGSSRWAAELGRRLAACDDLPLPREVEFGLPEGFAQYGHYPECHLAAAERVGRELRPVFAMCIGLRSIGTTLSAIVAACLEDMGCRVGSCTLRPRGHPFDRHLVLGESLRSALAIAREALFLVVDEGPGISGSSLAGAAAMLSDLGIPDDRIVLLPSWDPDPEHLRSVVAQRRWTRHRRYVSGFDEVWVRSGRLAAAAGGEPLRDISAGRWRDELISDPRRRPPTHPHHERRKFQRPGALMRFAGLGALGHARLERARALGEAGFSPQPAALVHGFLLRELVPGVPLARGEADGELLDRMGRYLAWLRTSFPVPEQVRTRLDDMVRVNLAELGLEWRRWGTPGEEPAVALDGRMLPHEWLKTARGYLKVDALDHHDDHFYPGPVDIAWDLAGAEVEFDLTPAAREALVERYRRASGDRTVAARLPYYRVAYTALPSLLLCRAGSRRCAACAGNNKARRYRFRAARPGAAVVPLFL